MRKFIYEDETYSYDENLWKLIPTPNNVRCTHTIHYIGPIVNGKIIGHVPYFPSYLETFCNNKELIHPPIIPNDFGMDRTFYGCSNLQLTIPYITKMENELSDWDEGIVGGYDYTGSPNIIDDKDGCYGIDLVARAFGVTAEVMAEALPAYKDVSNLGSIYSIGNALSPEDILSIVTKIKPEKTLFYSSGAYMDFREAKASSEILYKVFACNDEYILTSKHTKPGVGQDDIIIYKIDKDFIVNSDDEKLIAYFGRELNNVDMHCTYDAGENGVIINRGMSCIETAGCPISATGTLTIKGSGFLDVVCKARRYPCIGTKTRREGRTWLTPDENAPRLNNIIIDGVHVKCASFAKDFCLGTYGLEYVPNIELLNGGTIECPEAYGERKLVQPPVKGKRRQLEEVKYECTKKAYTV